VSYLPPSILYRLQKNCKTVFAGNQPHIQFLVRDNKPKVMINDKKEVKNRIGKSEFMK